MIDKRPIDKKRESGGRTNIGTEEDGAILEMIDIDRERLIVIKDKAIYEFMTADNVDPERTNIALPNNIQKLLFNQGANSETVSRIFLQSKMLFRSQFFGNSIDTQKALLLSLDVLKEQIALEEDINEYLTREQTVSKEYEDRRSKSLSYAIPSINDVETRCKTIFQKAYHIEQILMEIIVLFYQNDGLTKQSHYPLLYEVLKNKYGENDPFPKFVDKVLEFMKIVRSLRNSLDHRLGFAKVRDFELQTDGSIISPTIELKDKDVKLERQSIAALLPTVLHNMITIFENTIAHLSNANTDSHFIKYTIKPIPEEVRRYKYVRYSFWSPLGNGYFHQ